MTSVVIDRRFQGLEKLAVGGYVAGLLGGGRPAEVRLRRPTPVGRSLEIEPRSDGSAALRDGEVLLALAVPGDISLDVPAPVSLEEAAAAAHAYPGFRRHLFPSCFVCGPSRAAGDGLRIFPAPIPGRDLVAAPWTPDASLPRDDGFVAPEVVGAALDCPSIWSLIHRAHRDTPARVVSARLAWRLVAPIPVGVPTIVTGWAMPRDGERWVAGAAVWAPDGRLLAVGRHTLAAVDWGIPLSPDAWGLGGRV